MKCEWCGDKGEYKVETRPGSGMWIFACNKHRFYAEAIFENNKDKPLRRKMKK